MIKDYFRLAYSSAKHRQLRSWLTLIGVFIGIAAVVALISLSQGLENAIATQFIKLGSDKLIVQAAGSGFGPPGTAVSVPLTKKEKQAVETVKGVDIAVGRLIRIAKLEFKDDLKYAYVVSVPEDETEKALIVEVNDYQLDKGRFLEQDNAYDVILSKHINEDFFEKEVDLRDNIKIQDKQFEVVGLLTESGNPQKDHTFIIPEKALREILTIPQDYDLIAVKVEAGQNPEQVAESINKELRKVRNVKQGKEDFTVESPQQIIATLNNILLIIEGVLIGIAAISLFVGSVGIMNTMYTSVLERTKEIGIIKAVGAKNSQIMILFLIESGFLGLIGGVIGVFLGLGISKLVELIAYQIYQTPLIQTSISFYLISGALLFSFTVGAIAGTFPARQAAKLHPVEALRK